MPEISPELPAASAAPWCVAVPSSRMCEAVVSVFTASPSGSGWSWARVEDGFPESWHFGDNTHTLSLYINMFHTRLILNHGTHVTEKNRCDNWRQASLCVSSQPFFRCRMLGWRSPVTLDGLEPGWDGARFGAAVCLWGSFHRNA